MRGEFRPVSFRVFRSRNKRFSSGYQSISRFDCMFSNQPVAIYAIVCIIFEMENTFVDYTKRIARPHSFVPLGIGDDAALLANIPNMDMVVATDTAHRHTEAWLKKHIAAGQHVFVTDVTAAYGQLNIQGPSSPR